MKKAKMLCALALVAGAVGALASCDNGNSTGKDLKIGVGMISAAPEVPYSSTDGSYELELNFATAAWDSEGKVAASLVDVYQVQLGEGVLNKTGKDTYYFGTTDETKTKRDRHDDYGMANIASKGEWYTQAANLEKWSVGKKSSEMESATMSTDVTISTDDLVNAVKESDTHKKDKAVTVDGELTLALGHYISYEYADDTEETKDHIMTQVNIVALGVLLKADGTIAQAYLDEIQIPLTYTAPASAGEKGTWALTTAGKGQVGHDDGQAVSSKKEMGDDYNMVKYSGEDCKQGEWYVQAAKFEDYLVGKKVSDIKADAPTEKHDNTGTYISALNKAVDSALYNTKKF